LRRRRSQNVAIVDGTLIPTRDAIDRVLRM
jgi:hypothetical protein